MLTEGRQRRLARKKKEEKVEDKTNSYRFPVSLFFFFLPFAFLCFFFFWIEMNSDDSSKQKDLKDQILRLAVTAEKKKKTGKQSKFNGK